MPLGIVWIVLIVVGRSGTSGGIIPLAGDTALLKSESTGMHEVTALCPWSCLILVVISSPCCCDSLIVMDSNLEM